MSSITTKKNFWKELQKPFFVLAPMADVTDPAYRKLIAASGKPDVTWTEFVSADGLYHTREKKGMKDEENPLMRDLLFTEAERPVVAQFFSGNPDMMEYACRLAVEKGFDGVDINMGCPDKAIERQGAGAGHIKNPERAVEVIQGALRGVGGAIPVSVKTRIGYNTVQYKEWLPHLLHSGISTLTIHLRTRKEMSKVPAHYELASEIVEFCKKENPEVLVIGNGDIQSISEAKQKIEAHGFDGMMLGRAIFGNPWVFASKELPSQEERIQALHTLATYFSDLTPKKHYAILKKHFKAFISGCDGAAELRSALMQTSSLEEFEKVLAER